MLISLCIRFYAEFIMQIPGKYRLRKFLPSDLIENKQTDKATTLKYIFMRI